MGWCCPCPPAGSLPRPLLMQPPTPCLNPASHSPPRLVFGITVLILSLRVSRGMGGRFLSPPPRWAPPAAKGGKPPPQADGGGGQPSRAGKPTRRGRLGRASGHPSPCLVFGIPVLILSLRVGAAGKGWRGQGVGGCSGRGRQPAGGQGQHRGGGYKCEEFSQLEIYICNP